MEHGMAHGAMSTEDFLREVVFKRSNEQEALRQRQAVGDSPMSYEDYVRYVVYGEEMPEHKKRQYDVLDDNTKLRAGKLAEQQLGGQIKPGNMALEYNEIGKLARKVEYTQSSPVCWEYGYDSAGRLAVVMCQGQTVERYIYNEKGQRVLERCQWRGGERHFAYSPAGELVQAGDTRYFYTGNGSLAVKDENGVRTEYFYGPDSRLDSVHLPDGTVLNYKYGHSLGPVAKYCNDVLVAHYEWASPTQLASYTDHVRGVQYSFAYGEAHSPVAVQITTSGGSETYGIECDQVGTVKRIVSRNGSLIKEIAYDSFGNILRDSNLQLAMPVGFAGGLFDEHTGFVRFGYRDYDPAVGRFTAKDPARDLRGDGDLWDYCVDDPVNAKDSTGLLWNFALQGAIGVALAGVLNYDDYDNDRISGWEYAKKIAIGAGSSMVGAGVGGLATKGAVKAATHLFGNSGKAMSFLGGGIGGAVAGGSGEAAQQLADSGKISDVPKVLQSGVVGLAAGGMGTKGSALMQARQHGVGKATAEMSKKAAERGMLWSTATSMSTTKLLEGQSKK